MGHLLRIGDGSTNVDFGTSPKFIDNYAPKDGGREKTVTDHLKLVVTDATSITNVRTVINNLQLLFDHARDYVNKKLTTPVYLTFDPDSSGTLWRSLISDGVVDHPENLLRGDWVAKRMNIDVLVTRLNYFELTTASELTTPTTGDTIYNHADGGHVNYVALTSDKVTGVIQCGFRLEIQNNSSGTTIGKLFVGINAHPGSAFPTHQLEGESATGMTSNSGVGSHSNDAYGTFTTASSSTSECARWALSAADLAKFAGHHFHLLMRGAGNSGIYLQAKLCYAGTTVALDSANEVLLTTDTLHDLGSLQVPPSLQTTTTLTAVDVVLFGRKSGGFTLTTDFVHLFGVDGWRVYTPMSGGFSYQQTLKDDSTTYKGETYIVDASSNESAHYNASGDPLLLYPGQAHRLYILAMLSDGTAPIAESFIVKIFARPRRLTV